MSFASEIAARSPLGYWKMDDDDSSLITDDSGNGRHATRSGTITRLQTSLLADGTGKANLFDGGYGTIADASWMDTSYITFVGLYRPRTADLSGWKTIGSRWQNGPLAGSAGQSWILAVNGGKVTGYCRKSGGPDSAAVVGATSLAADTTYTIGLTWDGTTIRVWVNGVSDASLSYSGTLQFCDSNTDIGRVANASVGTSGGRLDEFALFSTALDSTAMGVLHTAATAAGSPVDVSVPVSAVSVAAPIPTVSAGATVSVAAPVLALSMALLAPTVSAGTSVVVAAPVMAVTMSAPAPDVVISTNVSVAVPVADLSVSLLAPTVTAGLSVVVDVPVSALTFAALAPNVVTESGLSVAVPLLTLTIEAHAPVISGALEPERAVTARVYTPSGVRVIVPLVPVADIVEAEPLLRVSHVMPVLSDAHPVGEAGATYPRPTKTAIGYVHLWIGGQDVTYLRDVPTTIRRWESETPFGDTAAAFEFPQLNPWDVPGAGDLACLHPDATVAIGIVHEGVVRRVWSGFLDARGNGIGEGEDYAWEAKGTLWAAHHGIREPVPFTTPTDVGVLIARTLNAVIGRRWALMPETPIGILTRHRGSRDESHWDYVQALLSEAWTDDGRQWTLFEAAPGIFTLRLKPLPSVVDATVAYGTPGVEIDLRVDESTRVDGVYARAIGPGGGGWANIFYPALELLNPPPYPNDDASNMGVGDTDADTSSGTGVSTLQRRINELGTFGTRPVTGVFTSAWSTLLREVQASIGVLVDGSPGPQTWNAIFDRGGEGIDLTPLRLPLAVKTHIMPRLYTATGVDRGPNPDYDETVVPRFIAVDLGPMKTKTEGRMLSRNILSVYGEAEAFGTATWIFDPNETDRTRLTHLTNVKVTGHESEDRVLMVVRKTVELEASDDGPAYVVTTTLDQRARDAMAVEDLLEQKRSAQADPSRRPGNPAKASRQVADQRTPWDSESPCGVLRRTAVNGAAGLPSVITIPFAEVGKLAGIRLQSTQPFAFMLCASLRITENRAHAAVNPFASTDPWRQAKAVLDEFGPIEAWGELDQACGFSPGTEADGYPFSGDFTLDSPVDYWTETPPYISLVVWMQGASGFIEGTFLPAYEGA